MLQFVVVGFPRQKKTPFFSRQTAMRCFSPHEGSMQVKPSFLQIHHLGFSSGGQFGFGSSPLKVNDVVVVCVVVAFIAEVELVFVVEVELVLDVVVFLVVEIVDVVVVVPRT